MQAVAIDVTIAATFSDGHVGRVTFRLGPGQRVSRPLSELRPAGAGQFDAGVQVTTSLPAAVSVALWDDPAYQRQGIARDLLRVPVCGVP